MRVFMDINRMISANNNKKLFFVFVLKYIFYLIKMFLLKKNLILNP